MPFGLLPEQAAEGRWGEALRLVLTPSTPAPSSEGQREKGSGAEDSDALGPDDGAAQTLLTLPGGLWDAVRVSCVCHFEDLRGSPTMYTTSLGRRALGVVAAGRHCRVVGRAAVWERSEGVARA